MSILYGLKAINQSAASNIPFVFGFNTARSVADDQLLALWNGPTAAGIKFAVDKDGKLYSASAVAGDMLYAVAGGIANVRRFDSLAIGAVGKVLRSNGSAPTWSTATIPDTAVQGDLLFASAANVWGSLAKGTARQVLQINAGATLPEWTTDLSVGAIAMSGALTMSAAVSQLVPGATSFAIRDNANANNNILVSNAGLLTVRAGITVTSGATTLGGDLKFSTTQNIVAGAVSLNIRNNADNANNVAITDAGVVTIRAGLTVTAGALTLGAATSQVIPGATSFAIRDTGNANDNLLVSNAGLVTVRAGLTVTSANLTFGATSARIIPGATDLSFRNNANNADNILISDSGLVAIRNGLTVSLGTLTITAGSIAFGAAATAKIISPSGAGGIFLRNGADSADNVQFTDSGLVVFRNDISVQRINFLAAVGKIVAGATSLSLRNTADSADNLIVTDAGLVTFRLALRSAAANPAAAGVVRLGNAENIAWRNAANSADLTVGFDGTNSLFISAAVNIGNSGGLQSNGTQVVGVRRTGWTAWTGTAARGTQNADAPPTVTQVAQAFKALLDDLIAHGLVGP